MSETEQGAGSSGPGLGKDERKGKAMQTQKTHSITLFREAAARQAAGQITKFGRQAVASALMLFLVPLSIGDVYAFGQDAPPPPPDYNGQGSAYQPMEPEDLNRLVAPIALYPDSLVAQTLAASTYPAQVASAEQFVQQSGGAPPEQLAQMADQQPWDPSVKALTAFPQVLQNLNQNMQWTTQLGNAYYNQPQDVMTAVQVMRDRAYRAGNLRRTEQLNVVYNPGAIVIEPVSPEVVYVPYYNPWVVYGPPVAPWGYYHYYGPPRSVGFGVGLAIGFGVGIAVGAFTHFGWGYHSWAPNWGARTVVYNHNTYISNSVTVVNHGNYGGFDRNPQARAFNRGESVRFANVNHTTINNVSVNRTNMNNINRTNVNNNNFNRTNVNNGGMNPGRPGAQPGNFNPRTQQNFNRGPQAGTQPGQLNSARPTQTNAGQFNNERQGGQRAQMGQPNGRPATQPGQFNSSRPTAQPGQFNSSRPAQPGQFSSRPAAQPGQLNSRPAAQPGQFNGGQRPSAAPQNYNRAPQVQSHPAPQQQHAAPRAENHGGGEHGGGEHHR